MKTGSCYEINFGGLTTRLAIYAVRAELTGVLFGGLESDAARVNAPLRGDSPEAEVIEAARRQIEEYAAGKRRNFDVPLRLSGTDFQMRVWNALLDIPYGETRVYRDIARAAGNEAACRAAGGAIHNNPISIIVPCHRVIGADGGLTGFGGGIPLKKTLLQLEGAI
jgi:methylated-DNA-[protein]-cysteine S-methyltransferase